ncbi:MAG TPA: hypothetical protein VF316_16435 [Polyangiaceae bacterium]
MNRFTLAAALLATLATARAAGAEDAPSAAEPNKPVRVAQAHRCPAGSTWTGKRCIAEAGTATEDNLETEEPTKGPDSGLPFYLPPKESAFVPPAAGPPPESCKRRRSVGLIVAGVILMPLAIPFGAGGIVVIGSGKSNDLPPGAALGVVSALVLTGGIIFTSVGATWVPDGYAGEPEAAIVPKVSVGLGAASATWRF